MKELFTNDVVVEDIVHPVIVNFIKNRGAVVGKQNSPFDGWINRVVTFD